MKSIPLSRGLSALVDDEDYEYLSQWKWHAKEDKNTYYAARSNRLGIGGFTIRMHSVIMNAPKGKLVDHIDGNGLNNRRSNLRIVTYSQNAMNAHAIKKNSSGYKGVSIVRNKFLAQIYVHGETIILGYFKSATEAAKAYDDAAKKYFGEYAKTNF